MDRRLHNNSVKSHDFSTTKQKTNSTISHRAYVKDDKMRSNQRRDKRRRSRSKERLSLENTRSNTASKEGLQEANPSSKYSLVLFYRNGQKLFLGEYFHDLVAELAQRKKAMEERLRAVPEQQNIEVSQKEVIRARTKEAKYIASLFKVMNMTRWDNKDKTRFIISAKWFSKWKAYVGYDELFSKVRKNSSACSVHSNTTNHTNLQYSFLASPHPGSISNNLCLLIQVTLFMILHVLQQFAIQSFVTQL